jgi:imidazole glycerol-phosphate synthase subunit HisF
MALKTRIIPIVLWDGRMAVHTVSFGNPQSAGSIEQALGVYAYRSCDELVILDIMASRESRGPSFDALRIFSTDIFCPLTVGGGVTRVEDAVKLIAGGADKVVLGKACRYDLLRALADKIGCQSVMVALDHRPDCSIDSAVALALFHQFSGAGEILLTSMWHQGRREGYNLPLIQAVSKAVDIPVIANGGAGEPKHMLEALDAGAHAVAAGTMFLFSHWTPRSCAEWLSRAGVKVRLD